METGKQGVGSIPIMKIGSQLNRISHNIDISQTKTKLQFYYTYYTTIILSTYSFLKSVKNMIKYPIYHYKNKIPRKYSVLYSGKINQMSIGITRNVPKHRIWSPYGVMPSSQTVNIPKIQLSKVHVKQNQTKRYKLKDCLFFTIIEFILASASVV